MVFGEIADPLAEAGFPVLCQGQAGVQRLVEAFRDDDAGGAHVRSEHFATATSQLPAYLQRTPDIVNATVPGEGWSELGEMAVR
jgi:hypothetical protein